MSSDNIGHLYDSIASWWSEQMESSKYGLDYLDKALRLIEPGSFVLDIGCGSVFHAPKSQQRQLIEKMCGLLNNTGVLLFTAGGIDDERSGEMQGVIFHYGSLKYTDYLDTLDKAGCRMILMERDQYPEDHMVFLCQKTSYESQ